MIWGFRSKVILASIIPALLVAIIVSFTLVSSQLRELENTFLFRSQGMSDQIAADLGNFISLDDVTAIKNSLRAYLNDNNLSAIQVNDRNNQTILKFGSVDKLDKLHYYSTSSIIKGAVINDDIYDATGKQAIRNRRHKILGNLTTYFSYASLEGRKKDVITKAVAISAMSLFFSLLISLAFQNSIILSFGKLKNAIHRISQGKFDTRIEDISKDEIGLLENDINSMTSVLMEIQEDMHDKIESSSTQLQKSLEEIENKNRELNIATEKTMDALRIKTDFMANMSHEIRTPMNGIIGFANLLLRSNLTKEQVEHTQTIKTSTTNLLAIINDILDFSKLETGRFLIEPADINLREVIEDVINYMATSAHEKGLEFILMFYSDVPENIIADPIRIRQVASNIIANAIKFTKQGQVIVRVMLEDEDGESCDIKISVQDTGIGLSLKDQRKLFAAFSQADTTTTREFGGAGIGLVISKKIAEQMKGTIGMESKLAIGSTFWLQFPCQIQKERGIVQRQDTLSGTRCLLYDSNEYSRNSKLHHLNSWNIDVVETNNPEHVALIANEARNNRAPFQFIILGLNNLELKNKSLAGILANVIDEHHYAFATLINSTEQANYDACHQMGADICLPKSVRKKDFYWGLCSLLPNHFNLAVKINTEKREIPTIPYDLSALNILVVDDNRINRKLITTLLEQSYAYVFEATTGQDAVDQALINNFDLIFMDIHMPVMNGIDASNIIKSSGEVGKKTPIIALTANAVYGERERLIQAGLDSCLIKPIHEQDLWSVIVKWVAPEKIKPMQAHMPKHDKNQKSAGRDNNYTRHVLKGIDNRKAIDFAGGNRQLADELYTMFIDDLPNMKNKLVNAYKLNDLSQLEEETHKIHGAASCCAVFQIKNAADKLEKTTIRGKTDQIPVQYEQLLNTIDELLENRTA